MRSKSIAAITALMSSICYASAQESGSFYVEGGLGVGVPVDDELVVTSCIPDCDTEDSGDLGADVGFVGRLLLGYASTGSLAFELEAQYITVNIGDTSILNDSSALTYTANVVYGLDSIGRFSPYIGLGVGYTSLDVESSGVDDLFPSDYDGGFTYQLKAGVAVPVNSQQSIRLQLAYLDTDDFEAISDQGIIRQEFSIDYATLNATVGYRFAF